MASSPKVTKQASAEEIEARATALAQQETNEVSAAKRKSKKTTLLSSLDTSSTALGTKTNTGT